MTSSRRSIPIFVLILLLSAATVTAQTAPPPKPSLALAAPAVALTAGENAHAEGMPPNSSIPAILIDPGGDQKSWIESVGPSGTVDMTLLPPHGSWQVGLYRLILALGGGHNVSGNFAAEDGAPHLWAGPYLPSPTSAFSFVGVGLPKNTALDLTLWLTGGEQSSHPIHVLTDSGGSFSAFAWPQEFGLPFFAAGDYLVTASVDGLSAKVRVREHPGSSVMSLSAVPAGGVATVYFRSYTPGRYLWGIYSSVDGRVTGDFMVGPTNPTGNLDAQVGLESLPPGEYLLATPYDWGETTFTILDPTDTPTATATSTPSPTLSPTAKPAKKHHRRRKKRKKRQV